MKIYSKTKEYTLLQGNMLDMWEFVENSTIDSIVTDPPYELNFMWKGWDNSWIAFQKETREKCLEVLKPWGYLLAFGGSRTYHRIACAIEDAGFEIRDCIMWLYGSWFPKSMNIWLAIDKKNWVDNRTWKIVHHAQKWVAVAETIWAIGWWAFGEARDVEERKATNERAWWWTALKPSYEPIIVARKPLEWSCTDNVIKYWVGGINIDECRVEYNWTPLPTASGMWTNKENHTSFYLPDHKYVANDIGRFPANTILTYWDDDKEEVCSGFPNTKWWGKTKEKWKFWMCFWKWERDSKPMADWYEDEWSAARYFYCAKASKRDRDEGLDEFEEKKWIRSNAPRENEDIKTQPRKNIHPTVKPCDLMQYLVRLVTPNGWTVLDPFNWSGSTGKAVMYENKDRNKNYKYIWIELTEEYLPIAKARIEYVIEKWWELREQTLF